MDTSQASRPAQVPVTPPVQDPVPPQDPVTPPPAPVPPQDPDTDTDTDTKPDTDTDTDGGDGDDHCPPYPECPPQPPKEEGTPIFVPITTEIVPVVSVLVNKPKICLQNKADTKPCYFEKKK